MIENFDFDIKNSVKRALADMGFEKPTEIQAKAIPLILEGGDVIGKSQTGSGKTVAFGIPAIEVIDTQVAKKNTQVLILCPTRELAMQATEEIRKLTKYTHNIKTMAVYGGQPIARQIPMLKQGMQIVVGTPGRIMDHLRRKTLKLSHLKMVVLDEADEMLNMGFREDIETILKETPQDRQTILFSATMPRAIMEIVDNYQTDPVSVEVKSKQMTVDSIKQHYINCPRGRKQDTLLALIKEHDIRLSIIFCNTKRMVDELTEAMEEEGIEARGLHGDMRQRERDRVMQDFRKGKATMLIATDVAARGIDINNIEAVINYDLPQQTEYYVHRIGRTGRAGKTGISVTLLQGKRQKVMLDDIAKQTKSTIEPLELETIEIDNNFSSSGRDKGDRNRSRGRDRDRDRNSRNRDDRKQGFKRDYDRKPKTNTDEGLMFNPEDLYGTQSQTDDRERTNYSKGERKSYAEKKSGQPDRRKSYDRDDNKKSFDKEDRRKSYDREDRKKSYDKNDRDFDKSDKFDKKTKQRKDTTRGMEMYTLRLSVGRKAGATPKNVLGAVAGESGIKGSSIGDIAIKDSYTLVDIPAEHKDKAIKALNGARIAGKVIKSE